MVVLALIILGGGGGGVQHLYGPPHCPERSEIVLVGTWCPVAVLVTHLSGSAGGGGAFASWPDCHW